MLREEWLAIYDEIQAVRSRKKDIVEVSLGIRTDARSLGLLRTDINGNTVLTKKAKMIFREEK
jgi:hypothetical protein